LTSLLSRRSTQTPKEPFVTPAWSAPHTTSRDTATHVAASAPSFPTCAPS
jgi:hypothetical protein